MLVVDAVICRVRNTRAHGVKCLLVMLLTACGPSANKNDKSSSAENDEASLVVSGVLSLDIELAGHEVLLFQVTEGKEIEQIGATVISNADGSYEISVPASGTIAIEPDEMLITMSKKAQDGKTTMLWSYFKADGTKGISNLNVLSSIAYEIGVWEENLKGVASANERTAAIFGFEGTEANLEKLDSKHPKLLRLAKVVALIIEESAATAGDVHKSIAKDIMDGDLDGKTNGTDVALVKDGFYVALLTELKSIISDHEPDLVALKEQLLKN